MDMGYAGFFDMSPLATKTSASSGCNHDGDNEDESCDEHFFDLHSCLYFVTIDNYDYYTSGQVVETTH